MKMQRRAGKPFARSRTVPEGDNRVEKAAKRLQAAVRRRKTSQQAPVSARDFTIQDKTWCGMDDCPVPILAKLEHESTGVMLLDPSEASEKDITFMQNLRSDALCIIVVGHHCPHPATCSGRLSVPVFAVVQYVPSASFAAQLDSWRRTVQVPPSFHVVSLGMVPGL